MLLRYEFLKLNSSVKKATIIVKYLFEKHHSYECIKCKKQQTFITLDLSIIYFKKIINTQNAKWMIFANFKTVKIFEKNICILKRRHLQYSHKSHRTLLSTIPSILVSCRNYYYFYDHKLFLSNFDHGMKKRYAINCFLKINSSKNSTYMLWKFLTEFFETWNFIVDK